MSIDDTIEAEKFYTDRSSLVGKLTDYIELCETLGRNVNEEIEEVIQEAFYNTNIDTDVYVGNLKDL